MYTVRTLYSIGSVYILAPQAMVVYKFVFKENNIYFAFRENGQVYSLHFCKFIEENKCNFL